MKKQYTKPATTMVAAHIATAMLAGSPNAKATIGNDGENGTGDQTIGEVSDGSDFTMEGKKNNFNVWDD